MPFANTAKIFFISLGLSVSSLAFAAPASDQDIEKLIKLSELDLVFSQSLKQLEPLFDDEAKKIVTNIVGSTTLNPKQLEIAQQLSQAMNKTTQAALFDPKVTEKLKSTLKTIYTDKEVKAYNAFLSTPEGQAINRKSPEVMITVQKFMEEILEENTAKGSIAEDIEKIISPLFEE